MEKLKVARELGVTGSTTILRLTGPLSLATAPVLQDELRAIGSVDTVIDISDAPYIDSTGLGVILSHWAHTQRTGKKFALSGTSARVRILLEITRVDTILPAYPTAEDADRAFSIKTATA